jgi:hypothetical protein
MTEIIMNTKVINFYSEFFLFLIFLKFYFYIFVDWFKN